MYIVCMWSTRGQQAFVRTCWARMVQSLMEASEAMLRTQKMLVQTIATHGHQICLRIAQQSTFLVQWEAHKASWRFSLASQPHSSADDRNSAEPSDTSQKKPSSHNKMPPIATPAWSTHFSLEEPPSSSSSSMSLDV